MRKYSVRFRPLPKVVTTRNKSCRLGLCSWEGLKIPGSWGGRDDQVCASDPEWHTSSGALAGCVRASRSRKLTRGAVWRSSRANRRDADFWRPCTGRGATVRARPSGVSTSTPFLCNSQAFSGTKLARQVFSILRPRSASR